LHREIPDDLILCRRWNELVGAMEQPQVFYTYEWALAVDRAYHESLKPLLILVFDGEELAGLVALGTDPIRQTAFFLTGTTADYCDFVSRADHRCQILEAVVGELRRQDIRTLVLANLPANSVTVAAFQRAARQHGYWTFARRAYLCGQIVLGAGEEREQLKRAVMKRKHLRYYIRGMEKQAPVRTENLKLWENIEPVLPRFVQAHVARFLATDRISNLAQSARRHFLFELAKLLSSSGSVVVTRLMVGDQPVAWNYGFQFRGTWFWYQPTFDSRWQTFSPGFCLLSKTVEAACDNPEMELIDLGLGSEGYKERFATGGRQTLHLTATTSTSVLVKGALRYHAANVIKSTLRCDGWVRTLRAHVLAYRERTAEKGPLAVTRLLLAYAKRVSYARQEYDFFEWNDSRSYPVEAQTCSLELSTVDLDLLALAAIRYVDDPPTLDYLLRASERLRSTVRGGLAVVDADGFPVQFCWTAEFEGFRMPEVDYPLRAPSPESVILFDWWNLSSIYDHNCKTALRKAAQQLRVSGKSAWIYSASDSEFSRREFEQAGFVKRFSLLYQRTLFRRVLTEVPPQGVSGSNV
jgi:CelD/BcsL family acetyltransferase involved in cellulose biosynthesis